MSKEEQSMSGEELRDLWQAIIDRSDEAVIGCDSKGGVVILNRRAEAMVGGTLDQARGRGLDELFCFIKGLSEAGLKKADAGGVPLVFTGADREEYRYLGRQNEASEVLIFRRQVEQRRWGIEDWGGIDNPSTMTLYPDELIEDERQREELRQWKERFEQVADQSRTVVWEVGLSWEFSYVSDAAYRIWGYEAAELVAKMNLGELHEPEVLPRLEELVMSSTERGRVVVERQWKVIRREGEEVWMMVNIIPLFDKQRRLTGYRGSHRDISEQKRAEERVSDYEQLLMEVSLVTPQFIASSDWSRTLAERLGGLGESARASRVYFFEVWKEKGEWFASQTHEWCGEGIEPQIENPELRNIPLVEAGYDRWVDRLSQQKPLVGAVSEFPAGEREVLKAQGIQSLVISPVFANAEWVGFLGFDQCDDQRQWDQGEQEVLGIVSDALGTVIARQRTERALEEARQRELETGAQIQERLLKGKVPARLWGMDVFAMSVPSKQVDGDFFDVYQMGDRTVDVVIADSMGKGVPAALVGAATKTQLLNELRCYLQHSGELEEPSRLITSLHEAISEQLESVESFITLGYYRFAQSNRELIMVDCGHTAALHVDGQGAVYRLKGENLPLGVQRGEEYGQYHVQFEVGDVFVFYSDGVIEATNEEGEPFGLERLEEVLREYRNQGAKRLVEGICEALKRFSHGVGETYEDDTTIICVVIDEEKGRREVRLDSDLMELARLRAFIGRGVDGLTNGEVGEDWKHQLLLASNEAFSNVVIHGCKRKSGEPVEVRMERSGKGMIVEFCYRGEAWEREEIPAPAFNEAQEGGFGLYLIEASVDQVEYHHGEGGQERIRMMKMIT